MNNPDFLLELCSRLDNTTLESLSHTPSWNLIKTFVTSQYFWYLRTQHLVGMKLSQDPPTRDWKKTYYLLQVALTSAAPFTPEVVADSLVVEILLERDINPALQGNRAIKLASARGHADSVRLLLTDPRVEPTVSSNYSLKIACERGYADVVALLLQDGRADPTVDDSWCLRRAVDEGHTEVVALLLQDGRADPAASDNYPIGSAAGNGNIAIVRLLLADRRVDPTSDDNYALRVAEENGYTEIVQLLKRR